MSDMEKIRSPRNRTLSVSDEERGDLRYKLLYPKGELLSLAQIVNKTICGDIYTLLDLLPKGFADVVILDPPYNLDKDFHGFKFNRRNDDTYKAYLQSWFPKVMETLKSTGSVYMCGDWKSTSCVYQIMQEHAIIRNRITWQREKGRGAKANWKNAAEDIWFGTKSNDYYFNVEAVKQKRKVLAPYRDRGKPKDWEETAAGNFRVTYPSNFWDDISIPYWSMPENTDHPTQKPEKLLAKLLLASCPPQGMVFDPFLGSGTTSVVAKKLGRHYVGIELNEEYCCWAEKRLSLSDESSAIQGYSQGVFWERNTLQAQLQEQAKASSLKY